MGIPKESLKDYDDTVESLEYYQDGKIAIEAFIAVCTFSSTRSAMQVSENSWLAFIDLIAFLLSIERRHHNPSPRQKQDTLGEFGVVRDREPHNSSI
jgi:hypothetical protein